MSNRIYFDEHIEYLREITPGRHSQDITDMFNEKFNMNATRSAIRTVLTKYKIRSKATTGIRLPGSLVFTKEEESFIKENHKGIGPIEMRRLLNKTFNKNYTDNQMKGYYSRNNLRSGLTGYFEEGHEPWNKGTKGLTKANKTSFKKGDKPHNWVPVGSERITTDGYIQVKIQEGKNQKNWKGKHILIWEEVNGPLPKGHVIIFGDGDKRNLNIDNLLLVTRAQLARLNQNDMIKNHANITKAAIHLIDLNQKIVERTRK